VRIVLAQPQFFPVLVARHHERIFGVGPAKADLDRWSARLAAEPAAFPEIVAEWIASDAYGALLDRTRARPARKNTDAMFIQSLFCDLLGRTPSWEEFRNFRNALQALSDSTALRAVLARVMLDSGQVPLPEQNGLDAEAFVRAQFASLLAREPSGAELAAFAGALAKGTAPSTVVLAILGSAEYQSR
jgi:hypothetical protein